VRRMDPGKFLENSKKGNGNASFCLILDTKVWSGADHQQFQKKRGETQGGESAYNGIGKLYRTNVSGIRFPTPGKTGKKKKIRSTLGEKRKKRAGKKRRNHLLFYAEK